MLRENLDKLKALDPSLQYVKMHDKYIIRTCHMSRYVDQNKQKCLETYIKYDNSLSNNSESYEIRFQIRIRGGGVFAYDTKVPSIGYDGSIFIVVDDTYEQEKTIKIGFDNIISFNVQDIANFDDGQADYFIDSGFVYHKDKLQISGINLYYDGSFARIQMPDDFSERLYCREPDQMHYCIVNQCVFMYNCRNGIPPFEMSGNNLIMDKDGIRYCFSKDGSVLFIVDGILYMNYLEAVKAFKNLGVY